MKISNRIKKNKYLLISFLFLFFIIFLSNNPESNIENINNTFDNNKFEEENSFNNNNNNNNNKDNNEDNKEDKIDKKIENEEKKSESINLYKIVSVVDGDTIKVYINNKVETIRLIGLDTPETVDPRKEVQCFGLEASKKAKEMLEGKSVILEKDESQGERDKYGRLLLYVYLEDNILFNKWMIENGYGHEYTYNIPYKYQTEFKNAEKYARENKLGLWADDACSNFYEKKEVNNSEIIDNLNNPGPQVKKSSTGICHERGTTYYDKTKNFTPYNSIEECLESGARMPKM